MGNTYSGYLPRTQVGSMICNTHLSGHQPHFSGILPTMNWHNNWKWVIPTLNSGEIPMVGITMGLQLAHECYY